MPKKHTQSNYFHIPKHAVYIHTHEYVADKTFGGWLKNTQHMYITNATKNTVSSVVVSRWIILLYYYDSLSSAYTIDGMTVIRLQEAPGRLVELMDHVCSYYHLLASKSVCVCMYACVFQSRKENLSRSVMK